jgi:hypothetical protein
MSEAVFRLAYDGEAVAEGEMDAADLASALLGVAQLLKCAGRVLEGPDAEIGVRVKETRPGSFEVLLNLVVQDAGISWAFWKSPDVQAAVGLLNLIGINGVVIGGGLIGLVRWLKGRTPRRVRTHADIVVFEVDGDEYEVLEPVARLVADAPVRAALAKVVADPLEREGISSVSLGDADTAQTIRKEEAPYFAAIAGSESDEFISRYTKAFTIVTLSFKSGQKWRLNDGHSNPLVAVSDPDFLAKVDAGAESFAKGDMLVCDVVETSRRTANGFRSEYEIERVREHRKYQPPSSLFGGGALTSV